MGRFAGRSAHCVCNISTFGGDRKGQYYFQYRLFCFLDLGVDSRQLLVNCGQMVACWSSKKCKTTFSHGRVVVRAPESSNEGNYDQCILSGYRSENRKPEFPQKSDHSHDSTQWQLSY